MIFGTTLPPDPKLDFALGIKYQREPWRIFESQNSEYKQAPVEDQFQIRPSFSFSFWGWADLAAVIPLAYQTAGPSEMFPSLTDQEGFHLLNPEIFLKIPVLHERLAGFGVAGMMQFILPYGSDTAFTNYPALQGAVALMVDWQWQGFGAALNTGVWLRESSRRLETIETNLNTDFGHEFFLRPGLFYAFEMSGYELALVAEGNLVTNLSGFFSSHNENAFQLLISLHFRPANGSEGFYAAAGSGARMQGGGYGVPIGDFDARLGYSLLIVGGGEAPVEGQEQVEVAKAPPAAKPTVEEGGEWQKPQAVKEKPVTAEEAEEVEGVAALPAGERGRTAPAKEGGGREVTSWQPTPGEEKQPLAVATQVNFPTGPSLIQLHFEPNQPAEPQPGMPSGSAVIPEAVRQQIRERSSELSRRIQEPGIRVVIIGFADKCFDGPPPLGNQYNIDLSRRRAKAMFDVLREELGAALQGAQVQLVAMGRRCANPACNCATPEMAECANDRRVEVFIDHGETESFGCPGGEYWLAR